MVKILKHTKEFISGFDSNNVKSLLFTGRIMWNIDGLYDENLMKEYQITRALSLVEYHINTPSYIKEHKQIIVLGGE